MWKTLSAVQYACMSVRMNFERPVRGRKERERGRMKKETEVLTMQILLQGHPS